MYIYIHTHLTFSKHCLFHMQFLFSAHMLWRMCFLQRRLDIHLSNHWCLSGLLHPPCFMTSLKPLPSTPVDPITLNRLHTDIKNIALWENASFPSAVHHCILITCCGLEENWCTMMTIRCVATQQFFIYFAHLYLWLCLSLGWHQCVLDVLRKKKDLLGLCPCNRPKTVVNLVWYHQIHDQPLILQQLKGVCGIGEDTAFA